LATRSGMARALASLADSGRGVWAGRICGLQKDQSVAQSTIPYPPGHGE
jgi:hypothetical protein